MTNNHEALYFNGLGSGQTKPWEAWIFKRLAANGVNITHAHVNWRSDETFSDLLDRMTALAQEQRRKNRQHHSCTDKSELFSQNSKNRIICRFGQIAKRLHTVGQPLTRPTTAANSNQRLVNVVPSTFGG